MRHRYEATYVVAVYLDIPEGGNPRSDGNLEYASDLAFEELTHGGANVLTDDVHYVGPAPQGPWA